MPGFSRRISQPCFTLGTTLIFTEHSVESPLFAFEEILDGRQNWAKPKFD
jgi:hypothetical protein